MVFTFMHLTDTLMLGGLKSIMLFLDANNMNNIIRNNISCIHLKCYLLTFPLLPFKSY